MKKSDLEFEFPKELIALKPQRPSRVLLNISGEEPKEILFSDLSKVFEKGDLLVINDTKVIPSRVLSKSGEEFLFIKAKDQFSWEVLFPARGAKIGKVYELPGGLVVELSEKGLPQTVKLSRAIDFSYFSQFGMVNLPPYILSERDDADSAMDHEWYQTLWAKNLGSVAAPTASLHFSLEDLEKIRSHGVSVESLTLHVGLGTFLPLKADDLKEHEMHAEYISIEKSVVEKANEVRSRGKRVWALGTTVARSLESVAQGLIELDETKSRYQGESKLFIYPPYQFKLVNGLLTNFHQPESTLLALVFAFFGMNSVKKAYAHAIKQRFRLFSYGDLSVWIP